MSRKAKIERKTRETETEIEIDLDGKGDYRIDTTIPFLDHMLSLFAKHGFFDLKIRAKGDTDVDYHHTVEDIGISLGDVVKKALGDMRGIRRYGEATVPMDETLTEVSIDISGRPYLVYNVVLPKRYKLRDFDPGLIEDFFSAFTAHCGVNIHINLRYGRDIHHIIESIFKAFGRSLDEATGIDPRIEGIQSTKGKI